jgi:AraC-like DNA-binding protein
VDGEHVLGVPARALAGKVAGYHGFQEATPAPLRRREGPGRNVVLIVSFGEEWRIDDERLESFAAGLYERQVTTEHRGRSFGMHVDIAPPAAYMLFGLPLHTLAHRAVPLDDVLGETSLVERLYEARDWPARFRLLDAWFLARLADARRPSPGVVWAWRRLVESDGRVPVGDLAAELGWSRKRIVARFREEIGLAPKATARLLRFERARDLATTSDRPDWLRLALECGYYDQSHLINEFRTFTDRTPETFLQDTVAAGA